MTGSPLVVARGYGIQWVWMVYRPGRPFLCVAKQSQRKEEKNNLVERGAPAMSGTGIGSGSRWPGEGPRTGMFWEVTLIELEEAEGL